MHKHNEPFRRRNLLGVVEEPSESLLCDRCDKEFKPSQGYYRCEIETCNYDFCFDCGKSGLNSAVLCSRGHPMIAQAEN